MLKGSCFVDKIYQHFYSTITDTFFLSSCCLGNQIICVGQFYTKTAFDGDGD